MSAPSRFGVFEREQAGGRKCRLRGSTTRRAIVSCRAPARRHVPAGSSVKKSLITTIMRAPGRLPHPSQSDSQPGSGRGSRCGHECSNQLREMPHSAGRGQLELDPIADQDQPNAVAVLDCRGGQQGRGLGGSIGLGRPLGTKPHACGNVHDQPETEGSLLDEPAHKRTPLASRHVPVQVPDVIARLVGAQFGERQADPRPGAVIGARKLRNGVRPDPEPQPPRAEQSPRHPTGPAEQGSSDAETIETSRESRQDLGRKVSHHSAPRHSARTASTSSGVRST